MKTLTCLMGRLKLTLLFAGLLAFSAPTSAVVYFLRAEALTVTMPGSAPIQMWGYASCTNWTYSTCGPATVPGPALTVPPGDPLLFVRLRNTLPVDTSIVIPGQTTALTPVWDTGDIGPRPSATARVKSFTDEAPAGGDMFYAWRNMKPGTYLYHSGTQPQVQVQMGLYGAVSKNAAAGEAYVGVPYDEEVTLLYSEIDPRLHEAVANGTYGTAAAPLTPECVSDILSSEPGGTPGKLTSTLCYRPQYFLINGKPFQAGDPPLAIVNAGERTLLRFLNAGLQTHVPMLNGTYMQMIAEDGNPYPWPANPRQQYSVLLTAAKTIDALVTPAAGTRPILDRRLNLVNAAEQDGGMLAFLSVQPAVVPVVLYFSTFVNTAVPGVGGTADNADVYSWDGTSFARLLDATAAGLPDVANVDGLKVAGSQIYLSFGNNLGVTVPGLGTVQDEDIVVYDSGTGNWSLYLDGSAVGLGDADSEDVDAFDILADGSLILSTFGGVTVPGLSGPQNAEDVLHCVPGSSAPIASCTWSVHFDGSDVALAGFSENVDGVSSGSGKLYLSTWSAYSVPEPTAVLSNASTDAGGDVFSCDSPVTGDVSGCGGFSLYFRASDHGLPGSIDAFSVP